MQPSESGALLWATTVLSDACRRDTVQGAIKNKLRGKRLLLERAVTLPPHVASSRQSRQTAAGSNTARIASGRPGTKAKRKDRKKLLAAATKAVSYEQALLQHAAWNDFYRANYSASVRVIEHMDWHGAKLRVASAASAVYASMNGIVVAETQRMLLVLNSERRAWIPKTGTTVVLLLPDGKEEQCDAGARWSMPD